MKRIIRSALAVIVAVAGLSLATLGGAGSASAVIGPCGTTPNGGQDGWIAAQHGLLGISANLTYRQPSICTGGDRSINNLSVSWDMLSNDPSVGGNGGWIQSGMWYSPSNCMEHFSQAVDAPGFPADTHVYGFNWWPGAHDGTHCASDGQVHVAWQMLDALNNRYVSRIDSLQLLSSYWTASTDWNPAYNAGQASTEVAYINSNIPGTATAPTVWANIQYSWQAGTLVNGCALIWHKAKKASTDWAQDQPDCTTIRAWTANP